MMNQLVEEGRLKKMIEFNINKKIGIITINRKNSANAINNQLLNELNQTITVINNNEEINCVIITGQGEKVFSAGADLKERETMTDLEVIETVKYIGETVNN